MSALILPRRENHETTTDSSPTSGTKPKLGVLTNSRLQAFRRCPMEHRIRYDEGIVPLRDAEALRLGTLVHKGLEAWWRCSVAEERIVAAVAALHDSADEDTDAYELVKAEEMLFGYDGAWSAEEYEVLGVEVEFNVPLVNPATGAKSQTWELAGKLDALVRDRRGDVLLVEHKTTSQDIAPGSSYWAARRMDSQVSAYYQGARAMLGVDIRGCVYDVLRKPLLRPLQVNSRRAAPETPDEYRARVRADIAADADRYYQRQLVVRLEPQVQTFAAELWQQGLIMRDAEREGWAPRNPDSCQRFGQTCVYFAACSGEAELDDPSRYRRVHNVHPELARPARGDE